MFRRSACAFFATSAACMAATGVIYANSSSKAEAALNPSEFRNFKLMDVENQSPDTRRFRFAFPDPDMVSGVHTAACLVLKYTDKDGNDVTRPYTPVTGASQEGFIDLVVKRYPNSKMGSHLFNLKNGDTIGMKGPFTKIEYQANKWKHIGMIAGGTGITPMYQVMKEIADNAKDTTKVSLLYFCKSEEDILLAEELSKLGKQNNNFNVHISLTQQPSNKPWFGPTGRVDNSLIEKSFPKPGTKDTLVMVCGPSGMMKSVSGEKDYSSYPPKQGELLGMLKDIGYNGNEVCKF